MGVHVIMISSPPCFPPESEASRSQVPKDKNELIELVSAAHFFNKIQLKLQVIFFLFTIPFSKNCSDLLQSSPCYFSPPVVFSMLFQ
eukprot:g13416.t1